MRPSLHRIHPITPSTVHATFWPQAAESESAASWRIHAWYDPTRREMCGESLFPKPGIEIGRLTARFPVHRMPSPSPASIDEEPWGSDMRASCHVGMGSAGTRPTTSESETTGDTAVPKLTLDLQMPNACRTPGCALNAYGARGHIPCPRVSSGRFASVEYMTLTSCLVPTAAYQANVGNASPA